MQKKQLIALHSWLGLKLSALMFIVSLTGTLAVLSYEIDWLLDADMRVTPQNSGVNWDKMATAVRQTYPERQLLFISAPLYSNFAAVALTMDPELGARRTLLNPYTGNVTGDKHWYASAQRVLRDLHRYLLSPVGGIYLVGPLAVVLLISVVTALLFYRKWWRGFFKLRFNNGSRAFWGSFHKVSGLWSLWFVLLIAITGVWYLAEAIISDIGINIQFERPAISQQQLAQRQFTETLLPASTAIAIAKQQISNFTVKAVTFPRNQKTPYYIVGQTDAMLVRNRSNHVFIDPVSGKVLSKQETHQQTAFARWIDMADPLHFGNFAGLTVKFIWFGFGVLICGLTVTGIVIFIKRIKHKNSSSTVHAVLGSFKYTTALVLCIPLTVSSLMLLDNYDYLSKVTAEKSVLFEQNGIQVKLSYATVDNELLVRYHILCEACLVNHSSAELVLTDGEAITFSMLDDGYRAAPTAKLQPADFSNVQSIRFTLPSGAVISFANRNTTGASLTN